MSSDTSSMPAKMGKPMGIIVSIVMVLLGIGVFMAPQFFASIMLWIFVVGVFVYGIYLVFDYARSEVKNGWNLTTGIMAIILGLLLLFAPTLAQAQTFAFVLGFMVLFTGINQIASSSMIRRQGGDSTGWLTASGIINIILGFFFLFNPYVMLYAFYIIAGIYLIIGGIALFASSMSSKGQES